MRWLKITVETKRKLGIQKEKISGIREMDQETVRGFRETGFNQQFSKFKFYLKGSTAARTILKGKKERNVQ
jgi:hypothetical protein